MRNRWIVLASIVTLLPACLGAQPTRGDRLRIRQIDGVVVTGTLVEATPGAMQLEEDGVDIFVERDRIRTVERSLGVRGHFARNFAVSVGAGALLMGAYTALSYDCSGSDCWFGPDDRGGVFAIGALAGGIVAIPIGLIAGIASRGERWETTAFPPPSDFTLLLGTARGGGIGVSMRVTVGRVR